MAQTDPANEIALKSAVVVCMSGGAQHRDACPTTSSPTGLGKKTAKTFTSMAGADMEEVDLEWGHSEEQARFNDLWDACVEKSGSLAFVLQRYWLGISPTCGKASRGRIRKTTGLWPKGSNAWTNGTVGSAVVSLGRSRAT